MRATRRLLTTIPPPPVTGTPRPTALTYSLGLSYAAKQSPPFVPPNAFPGTLGFAGQPTKLGKWVDSMRALPGGRGDLRPSSTAEDGGWDASLREEVLKWGAGEDFFAVVDGGAFTHLAVSDGVGGWAPKYDPALYAQGLMYHYAMALAAKPSLAPWDALQRAFEGVTADDEVKAGSATAVGVSLGDTGRGRAVNLGDSGITILRRGQTVFETVPQTHYFNCPVQLAKVPAAEAKSGAIEDVPAMGERLEFELEPGDVVLLYTDGLADNLPPTHIPALSNAVLSLLSEEENTHLSRAERGSEHARLLADVLVAASRRAMLRTGQEKDWRTPFDIESAKYGPKAHLRGGKIDDICVIAAVAGEAGLEIP